MTKLTGEVLGLEMDLEDARALLRRVLDALDRELEDGGRVPFDPDEIREFLGPSSP